MNEEILSLLLNTENEYNDAVGKAAERAEAYAEDRRKEQRAYIADLRLEWEVFEKAENDKLKNSLVEAEHRMEQETIQIKEHLKAAQEQKAEEISERLKREVLSVSDR